VKTDICRWQAVGPIDGITITSSREGRCEGGVNYAATPGPTGVAPKGAIVIGKQQWQVTPKGR